MSTTQQQQKNREATSCNTKPSVKLSANTIPHSNTNNVNTPTQHHCSVLPVSHRNSAHLHGQSQLTSFLLADRSSVVQRVRQASAICRSLG